MPGAQNVVLEDGRGKRSARELFDHVEERIRPAPPPAKDDEAVPMGKSGRVGLGAPAMDAAMARAKAQQVEVARGKRDGGKAITQGL